jgi:hypothetical protein
MGYTFSLYLFSLSKSATETALGGSEILLIISGLVLAFGAIGEYLAEHGKLPRCMEWPKLVFILMVVVSLLGEFIGDAGVFLFSGHLQTISDGEYTTVRLRAAELEKETLLLRKQLRTQGSRAALLMEVGSQERFVKIEPFRGQKIEIAQCGRQDNEATMAVITLMTLIRARGWIVSPYNPFVGCTTGLRVVVRDNAPKSTLAAAKALGAVLNELELMPPATAPFTQIPKPKPTEIPGWNPSSADTVMLVVLIHP